MTSTTILVLAVGAVSILLKASGPMILGSRPLPAVAARVMSLLGPALLSALVATAAFGGPHRLVLDARAAGLAAAAACIALRAPLLVTVVAAAAVTAGLRLVTG